MVDLFSLNGAVPPSGMHYEWKTFALVGIEQSVYQDKMRKEGWQPVPSSRHPEISTKDLNNRVIRFGMILMERPLELSVESRKEDFRANQRQIDSVPGILLKSAKEQVEALVKEGQEGMVGVYISRHVDGVPMPRENDLIFDAHGSVTNPEYLENAKVLRENYIKAISNGEQDEH